jgi:hypothetical protein
MKTKFINKEVPEDVLKNFDAMRAYAEMCDKKGLKNMLLTACNWFDSLEEKEVKDIPSSPYEFQVGDLVEVQSHPSGDNTKWDESEGFDNSWVSDMNSFVGKEFKVDDVHTSGVYLAMSREGWRFPPQSLKLIKKAK